MLWQKSPQYADMPHDQYMQTEEGKRSQQAFQQWGQWRQNNMPTPSKPGPGRPSTPMQPQGMTPSKPGPGRPSVPMMQNYGPGQAQPQQSPYAASTPYGQQPQAPNGGAARPPSLSQYTSPGTALPGRFGGGRAPQEANEAGFQYPTGQQQLMNRYGPGTSPGYMAGNQDTPGFNPTANRPPPFQSTTRNFDGTTSQQQPANRPMAPGWEDAPLAVTLPAEDFYAPRQQPANRPPPFQATTQNFDGSQSQMPNFQQRDAFISQINNQLGQMQQQSWQQPGMGAPQFNFPQLWGQAGQMVQQGFQNPFAQQPDGGNQIRQLLGGQQGRMMSQDAWGQMNPGSPYPSALPGLPQGAVARGASGDIIPSAIGSPLTGLPPGAIADGPPTAQLGGSINQDSAPRGSAVPAFSRPVLKAPGSPGDPSPPQTIRPTGNGYTPQRGEYGWDSGGFGEVQFEKPDAPPGQRFDAQAFEDKKRSLLDASAAAARAGDSRGSQRLRFQADQMAENLPILRARANRDKAAYNQAILDQQQKRSAANRQNGMSQGNPGDMPGDRIVDGFNYSAAQREYDNRRRAQVAANNRIPVAKRNAAYGSDANRRAYEAWG